MAVAKKTTRRMNKKSRTAPRSRRRTPGNRSVIWAANSKPKGAKWVPMSKDWRMVVYHLDGKPLSAWLQHKPCARGKQRAAVCAIRAGSDFGCYYCGAQPRIRRPSRKSIVIEGKWLHRRAA